MAGQIDPSSDGDSAGKVEPDRVGRMHARRREPSVRGQLARRLAGFKGRSRPAPSGGFGSGRMQRVIVKTHISRHRPGKARGSLTRHASYLGRDSVSADRQPGVFYDAARDEVNARLETAPWVGDRHHFRQIISPKRGEDLPGLTGYVREVMARIGKDLDTTLSWVAINHHNTDNAHGGVYSAEAHVNYLRSVQPGGTESPIGGGGWRVRSAKGRLAFVAGHKGSRVERIGVADDGKFRVDGEAFARFSGRGMQRVDVRATSHQTVNEQTEARAFTWLDRQTFGSTDPRLTASGVTHPAVLEAGQVRAKWLIVQGYAERSGSDPGGVRLLPGAIRRLTADEREAADRKLAERHGRPVVELPQGGSVTGRYHGVETLHSGKRAVVVTEEKVFVAPVRRTPGVEIEVAAAVSRTSGRETSVQAAAGSTQGIGTQMYLDGLEAGR